MDSLSMDKDQKLDIALEKARVIYIDAFLHNHRYCRLSPTEYEDKATIWAEAVRDQYSHLLDELTTSYPQIEAFSPNLISEIGKMLLDVIRFDDIFGYEFEKAGRLQSDASLSGYSSFKEINTIKVLKLAGSLEMNKTKNSTDESFTNLFFRFVI